MPFRPTNRYPHGLLSREEHVAFLEKWYEAHMAGPLPPSKKRRQRGEIFQIRGNLRRQFPGWHSNLKTIKSALASRREWREWREELLHERKEKLEVRREQKAQRKEGRERREKLLAKKEFS